MTLQAVVELVLAVGAVLLLARDMRRAWLDQLRRPITLLVAASSHLAAPVPLHLRHVRANRPASHPGVVGDQPAQHRRRPLPAGW